MASERSIDEFLHDIVDWGGRVAIYTAGMDYEAFSRNRLVQDAVIRCLEVVGEASGNVLRLEPLLAGRHPEASFAQAYRARNRTAHGYGDVNMETVWNAARVSCPALVAAVQRILDRDAG